MGAHAVCSSAAARPSPGLLSRQLPPASGVRRGDVRRHPWAEGASSPGGAPEPARGCPAPVRAAATLRRRGFPAVDDGRDIREDLALLAGAELRRLTAKLGSLQREFPQKTGAEAIHGRLEHILAEGAWPREVLAMYDEKRGIANHLVSSKKVSRRMIEVSLHRLARAHVAGVFDRLSRDLRANGAGFPDLLLFPRTGGKSGSSTDGVPPAVSSEGYLLVEVKGPGDQLQKNQRRWMRWFTRCGIPCRVAHVEWRPELSSAGPGSP